MNKSDKIIAIVDDEPDILDLIELNLEKQGYKVLKFENGKDFIQFHETIVPDLIVLDIMLPDFNGEEICEIIRKNDAYRTVPVLMLTAKQNISDKVRCLNLGADDYMTKPFSVRELKARVAALLRRDMGDYIGRKSFGEYIEIDFGRRIVLVDSKDINLTLTEFKILSLFAKNIGHIFSREKIVIHLGSNSIKARTVDVHIKNLRDKLGVGQHAIKNIRSYGYKMDLD